MFPFLKKIYWWTDDYLHMFLGYVRSALYYQLPKSYQDEKNEKGNIVLIPGLFMRWHFLKDIGDYFAVRGYGIHIISNIFYNHQTITDEAKKLHEYLEKHDLTNVTIIAHSKGGLIAKHYMANENTSDHRVVKLIAIASPFSGSHLVKFSPLRAMRELHPNSASIKEVAAGNRVNYMIVSIFPEFDNHILHKNGSYLEGAKNISLNVKGHHKILFDKRLPKIIEGELESN